MSMWCCGILAIFCAYAISTGDAVKCFECNSERDPACGDPFQYTHLPLVDCERRNQYQPSSQSYTGSRSVCKKTKTRVNGYYVVDRMCAFEETYGMDPCGGSRSSNNYGYRDSNSAYQQSSYPNNYGNQQNYGNNQYGNQQYGNNYGSNSNYGGSSYGYGPEHCSVCRYDGCNSASGVMPTFWAIVIAATVLASFKRL